MQGIWGGVHLNGPEPYIYDSATVSYLQIKLVTFFYALLSLGIRSVCAKVTLTYDQLNEGEIHISRFNFKSVSHIPEYPPPHLLPPPL